MIRSGRPCGTLRYLIYPWYLNGEGGHYHSSLEDSSLDRCFVPQDWDCLRPVSLYTQQLHITLTHISPYTSQQHLNHRIPRTPLLRT
jgi:hypothetical protein